MTIVVDASAIVAALVDDGPDGHWAADTIVAHPLAAPHHMPVEAANILRRAAVVGQLSADLAVLAHDDLAALDVELFPYTLLAPRSWDLRANLTIYDAAYVSLAELLGAPLATLDHRMARAAGPRCAFLTPEATAPGAGFPPD